MVPFFVNKNEYAYGIVPNIVRLAAVLRDAGGTVAWLLLAVPEPGAQSTGRLWPLFG